MNHHPDDVNQLVGHLFRHEAGKMAAVLSRLLGFSNLDTADDIVQDTLLKAMSVWKFHGIPGNPSAWLYAVARNGAIDVLRKERRLRAREPELAKALESEWTLSPTVQNFFADEVIEDSQLRMMFACCHPSIPFESQIALTLKTLCGLSINEIARAFLSTDETITKRLYRAREKIRQEKIELSEPTQKELQPRLDAVLTTLYLLFNEGYNSSQPDALIRKDLCEEAIRLALMLTAHPNTNRPQTNALMSLFCFQTSRFDSRLTPGGEIVTLKDQDRGTWNRELIDQGYKYFMLSSQGDMLHSYHVEAAIAYCHANAASFEQTNWLQIADLYGLLMKINPSPVTAMNRAIAIGYHESPARGIEELRQIKGLESNHHYLAALGDFLLDHQQAEEANTVYQQALGLTASHAEQALLKKKILSTKS